MNRTLLVLNALALVALTGLIVPPDNAAIMSQVQTTPVIHSQQVLHASPAGKTPSLIQPSSRLAF